MNIFCRITKNGWLLITSKQNTRFIEIITNQRAVELEQNIYFSHYRKNFYISIKRKSGDSYRNHHIVMYADGTIQWRK